MSLAPGTVIGDYEVVALLGEGGMGQVYKVRHRISDRIEAMKIVLPVLAANSELSKRFLREIRVQASLAHPNIASLHTAITFQDRLIMVMEYVEGKTLSELLKAGPIPADRCVDYMIQALDALSYAHARNVIHRDIKPANIMVTPSGQVKLMDFGIAKAMRDDLTRTGLTVGSLSYMSPEQIRGAPEPDARSDLYSLGVTFYEIAIGKRPFEASSDFALMTAHLEEPPRPPIELDPTLPQALNEIILTAIAKDPDKRFQSAEAFRNALRSVARHLETVTQPAAAPAAPPPVQAASAAPPPIPAAPAPQEPPRRGGNRLVYMLAGSIATIAILIAGVIYLPKWSRTHATPEQQPAAVETPAASPEPQQPVSQSPVEMPRQGEQPAPAAAETPAAQPPSRQNPVIPPGTRPANPQPEPVVVPRRDPTPSAPPLETPPTRAAEPQPALAQPQPAQPQAPAVDETALAELRDRFVGVAARANAVRGTLQTLERQQQASGLGLRRDIVASRTRLELALDDVQAKLNRQDVPGATASITKAEAELTRLEKFLGR